MMKLFFVNARHPLIMLLLSGCGFLVLVGFLFTGCASTLPVPEAPTHSAAGNPWARVLAENVEPDGTIHFDALKKDPSTLRAAAREVALSRPEDFATSEEELAFAINAYNILAMRLAVDTDLKPKQKLRFFVLRKQHYLGEAVSLWTLENRIIRPMGEPRIHFALNCMVRDCPRLLREPYRRETLEEQLHAVTVEFLNDPRHVRYNAESNTLYLSRIFKWYRKDFETDDSGLVEYVNRYLEPNIPETADVEWLPYDWELNQAPKSQNDLL